MNSLHSKAVDEDHSYLSSGKKRCYQTSKKRNCPAKIRVKRILKFPEYKIIGQPTARKKRQVSQQLKAEFSIQTRREPVTYVHIDSVDDHQYHLTGELAGFTQPIDKRVICQIKQLALEGHRNVSSVRILLKELAKELAPEAPENNRRFFPTNDDIRTHIYQTIVGSNLRSAQEDQANVRKLLETPGKFAEELKYLSDQQMGLLLPERHFYIISTTNGIETQYKTLKHFYLKEFGIGKSLANVLEVLLDKFFPDSQLSYRRENIKSFEESRNYSPEVPAFLRNRPRKFMRHCLDRLPPNVNEIKKEDIQHCGDS
ncbi:hypothetical protein ScPMuIL_012010 [Solemya velum]